MYLTLAEAHQKLEQATARAKEYTAERQKINTEKATLQSFLDDATMETPALDIATARVRLEQIDDAIEQLNERYKGDDIRTALNQLHQVQEAVTNDYRTLEVLQDITHVYTRQLSVEAVAYEARCAINRLMSHGEKPGPFTLTIRA